MTQNHVLVVDDDLNRCKMLEYKIKKAGYKVTYSTEPRKALEIFKRENIDVVVSDIRMSEMGGIELLAELKKIDPLINVILITAYGKDINLILEALRQGAYEYLEKIEDIDLLMNVIERAVADREIKIYYRYYKEQLSTGTENKLVGNSKAIADIIKTVREIAKTDSTILITGESGTGKEIVARMIHNYSTRADSNFISVNCAAINSNLLESELFGYKKGAFTGAYTNKDGLIKVANNGSLFLDEIAEMEPAMQAKLLRVIQEKEVTPIGSTENIPVNVRIISATNKNIEEEVQHGTFRMDLFYRLNVIRIDIPPLRERIEDIKPLFDHYVREFSSKYNKNVKKIHPDVYKKLRNYNWPGNVRELMNIIERLIVIQRDSTILASDIPLETVENSEQAVQPFTGTIEEMEKHMISEAIKECRGNKKDAAEKLGINLSTLYRKIKHYGIEE